MPRPSSFFFFNDTATTEIYTLSLHDALPISTLGTRSRPVKRAPEGLARIWLGDKRLTTRLYAAYRGGPCAYLSAASVRFLTPSFENRCCTWNLTVLSDRPSRSAIWGFVSPAATRLQTSRSRGVRPPGAPAARPAIQRRAACGKTSCPPYTCRIAVRVCCRDSVLSARPSAPASSADRSESPSL